MGQVVAAVVVYCQVKWQFGLYSTCPYVYNICIIIV